MIKDGSTIRVPRYEDNKEAQSEHRTLEERAAEYGGKLFLDGEFDWGEPVGREVW